jgi:hypothetical protein
MWIGSVEKSVQDRPKDTPFKEIASAREDSFPSRLARETSRQTA